MMHDITTNDHALLSGIAQEAIALVRRWLAEDATAAVDPAAARLAGVLADPDGLDFTIGFVDRVVRPEDLRVAGKGLRALAGNPPRFLPWHLRTAIRLGGAFGPILPGIVVPLARWTLRRLVGHLIVDARPARLGQAIRRLREDGSRLNLNLLGEAVLGEGEAARKLEGTRALLARDDVDYVSIKVSSVVSQLSLWAFDEAVDEVVARLTPLYELAAASVPAKFVNLDMEEYKDLDLTVAVFRRILDQPQLLHLRAGIVLQAYLPDALDALAGLTEWAKTRRDRGGAPIKVRLVKGANLAMERVDALVHGWPLATYADKRETDANYKRVLDYALTPENTDAVEIGVAGHNLFDLAFAWLLAGRRGVRDRVEVEMLLGMATGQAQAVRREVGGLLLYVPVVRPAEFDVAIAYLVRRLEENASRENFMSAAFRLSDDETLFERERERFLAAIALLDAGVPVRNRRQDRSRETPEAIGTFRNEPDTDPALPANRAWGRAILSRVPGSTAGADAVETARIGDVAALEEAIQATARAGAAWGARSGAERAEILHRAGRELAVSRAELIEAMAAETGKTIAEADPEVSEAIDFARYYAERARELDRIDGARFVPSALTVVTPPWNFPVAIPAGSTLAALAAGSAVIIKPAGRSRCCGAVMVEALWRAGVPREVLRLVSLGEHELGQQLVAHPLVDRVILTGAYETAETFRSWRHDLPLLAETSGKNAIVVTPSADFDLAAADAVKSAFGHAGQKCSAASLVILVGSAATSRRFASQLLDAARSLRVGYPDDPRNQMGPIIAPAEGKLLRGLTELGAGERWLLEPRRLDGSGRLWSPGIRTGVAPGSDFHLTEFFGPVLGVMHARTLDEAVAMQNQVAYGLTAGLHSLDGDEVTAWLAQVQAGNLYVNRGITGAIVQRQPFGGWKRSAVGPGAKAGGPNYLLGLGSWTPAPIPSAVPPVADAAIRRLIEEAGPLLDPGAADFLRRSAASDQAAWEAEYGTVKDVSGLGVERNLFRYRPVPAAIRLSEGEALASLVRALLAARRAQAPVTVSSALPIPSGLLDGLAEEIAVESDAGWLDRVADEGPGARRIRLLGGGLSRFCDATAGDPDYAVYDWPVTAAGRVEMLPFLHEQAISITAHRFGNPSRALSARIDALERAATAPEP